MSRAKLSRRAAVSLLTKRAACLSIVLLAWNGTVLRLARCVAQNAKTVEISLDQIIFNNALEPGTPLNGLGGLQVGPFAYDLAPYVHRNFTVAWQEQLRGNPGRSQHYSTDDFSSCAIAVEMNKLQAEKGGLDFLIVPGGNPIPAQIFVSRHFFVFTDVRKPPHSKVFRTGDRFLPLGYSFPAIETLPEEFADKWGTFLKKRAKSATHSHNSINDFYPFSKWAIATNFHLCCLKEITPESLNLLCRVDSTGGVKHKFCMCGLEKISATLAQSLVESKCHFWLSSHTDVSKEVECILREGSTGTKGGIELEGKAGLSNSRFTLCLDPVGPRPNWPNRNQGGRPWWGLTHFGPQFHERYQNTLPEGFAYAVLEGHCEHLRSFSKAEVEKVYEQNDAQKKQFKEQKKRPRGQAVDRPQNEVWSSQFNKSR